MQKEIILKIFITSVLLSTSLFSSSLSSTEITNMVSEIKEEREGISILKLEATKNPFIIRIPKKKEATAFEEVVDILAPIEIVYTLKAILNHAAFIDRKWYKQGDTIGNYKVGYVSSNSVVLKSQSSNKILTLDKKKKKFIKLNRGYR